MAVPETRVEEKTRVKMPADEPESFALDATRVIAYPDLLAAIAAATRIVCHEEPPKASRV